MTLKIYPNETESFDDTQIESQRAGLNDFLNYHEDGKKLYDKVFRYVQKLLRGNMADAEDVMNTVLENAWRNSHQYNPDNKLDSWIYGIARNACIDFNRIRSAKKRTPKSRVVQLSLVTNLDDESRTYKRGESQLDALELKERKAHVCKAVSRLIPEYRETARLFYFEGLKGPEVAEALGIPEGTVKSRLKKIRSLLEESLEEFRDAA